MYLDAWEKRTYAWIILIWNMSDILKKYDSVEIEVKIESSQSIWASPASTYFI